MRLLLIALCLGGCQSYKELSEDFCATAKVNRPDAGSSLVALCDDFEDKTIDSSRWAQNVTDGGVLAIEMYQSHTHPDGGIAENDPGYAYRGRGVLHATAIADSAAQLVDSKVTSAALGGGGFNPTFVRFFLWVGDSFPNGTVDVVDFADQSGKVLRSMRLDTGTPVVTDAGTMQAASYGSTLVPDHWTCIQLVLEPDAISFTLDELTSDIVIGLGELPLIAQPSQTKIGLLRGDDMIASTTETWIDDVIIDHDYISCEE